MKNCLTILRVRLSATVLLAAIIILTPTRWLWSQAQQSVYQMVRDGIAAAQGGDCEHALDVLEYAADRKRFAALPKVMRQNVLVRLQTPRFDDAVDKADRNSTIRQLNDQYRALANRADVSKAVEAVGRIEEVWLHSSAW